MPIQVPVLFLIFNRPDTTREVFEAIRQARPSRLYIASDGPRADKAGEQDLVAALRNEITGKVDWPCEVFTLFREKNLGCKVAVREAITWYFEKEDMGIILEDDCLPHPDFFVFCSSMLHQYKHDERVSMIAGTNYHLQLPKLESDYYFSRYYAIWGWAGWRRSWQKYDAKLAQWDLQKSKPYLDLWYANKWLKRSLIGSFDAASRDAVNTWDIQWFYTCLFEHTLCIVPKNNLITNIGASGTHTSENLSFHYMKAHSLPGPEYIAPPFHFPNVELDEKAFDLFEKKIRFHFIKKYLKRIQIS